MSIKQIASLASLSVCCLALAGGGQVQPPAPPIPNAALVQQLISTANEGRSTARRARAAGLGSPEDVHLWTTRWINARLMAAPDKQSRIAILTDGVKAAEEWESELVRQHNAGLALTSESLSARYERIEAQVALLAEQSK